MSTNKVRIDAPSGVVEVEGDKEFVEEQLTKILPLIQAAGFGAATKQPARQAQTGGDRETAGKDDTPGEAATENSRRRRKTAMPPRGSSCRDRIKTLKDDGFFKKQHTPSDIVDGLAKKGWTYKSNQVGAALTQMFEKGELQRTKDGSGFKYFWDRD